MTQKRLLLVLGVLTWFVTAVPSTVRGDVRRERSARRPYIVEIGEPYSIAPATVEVEADKMTELREYLSHYGSPDYAEIQEIGADWPWDTYEVRLYYLRRNLETDFGHVLFSAAMPNLGVLKFQGEIPASKRHEIEVILAARQASPPAAPIVEAPAAPAALAKTEEPSASGLTEALVARIEAAAERAAQAADRAAEQSEAAMHAADRTTTIVDKMIEMATPSGRRSQ